MAGAIDKESEMKFIVCAATLVFLLWGTPALAGPCVDTDGDLVCDVADNCTLVVNPVQTDTDGDDCGNVCDYDVDNVGNPLGPVDNFDIFAVVANLTLIAPATDLTVPIGDNISNFDIFAVIPHLTGFSGPSGTTAGTVRCP
jgi:hypothetical protein